MTAKELMTAVDNEYQYTLNMIRNLDRQNLEAWEKVALIESACSTARVKTTRLLEQFQEEREG